VKGTQFDEFIHGRTRLTILSLLAATEWADFRHIRRTVGVSDSAVSKQLSMLEEAGYAEIRKGLLGKRPRTSVRLSTAGRRALEAHAAALREIIGTELLDPDHREVASDDGPS
jgi:DNA-binding transcriptional ArsR family regulator